jgi:ATP-dependent Lon protease
VLAAHRAGIKTVILPRDNEKDLKDIPDSVLESLKIEFVEHMDQVLQIALEGPIRKEGREEYVKDQQPPPLMEGDSRPGVH